MAHVQTRADMLGEKHVAGDDRFLCDSRPAGQAQLGGDDALVHLRRLSEAGILRVLRDDAVECLDVLQGTTHDQRIPDAEAVIAEDANASPGAGHGAQLGQPLALLPDGDCSDRLHGGVAGGLAEGELLLHDAGGVGDRLGVGHREHGGEPTGRSRPGSAEHRLGGFESRLAQMRVQIDQPREGDQPGCVDHARAGSAQTGSDLGYPAVLDHDVGAVASEQLNPGDDESPAHLTSSRSSFRSPARSR
ncbi:hypothetical protein GCM10025863_08810 [Microbacterium suwonense]|uniref:Uncharacterized protein n=1 Tax=Microbacterium suwonense TaxID=683047 RepID=A0ABM8FRJ5_9MICO|nr:hypothetical protein GCM10025863_08810 [Microbacterium suwonense]